MSKEADIEDTGTLSETEEQIEVIRLRNDYQEQIIQLKVGNDIYRVPSGRLMRSAQFKTMLSLPQASLPTSQPAETIDCSDIDPDLFKDYMWYIHADPCSSQRFFAQPPSCKKCTRLLSIAIVAHRFEASEVTVWAADEALNMLCQTTRGFEVDVKVAKLLLQLASRLQAPEQSMFVTECRDVVCDALHPDRRGPLSVDPISALDIARDDDYVLPHVYFYILRLGAGYNWKRDARLRPVDRRRLLCGLYSLGAELPAPARVQFITLGHDTYGRFSRRSSFGSVIDDGADGAQIRRSAWQPLVHHGIAGKRNELWEFFDEGSWEIAD